MMKSTLLLCLYCVCWCLASLHLSDARNLWRARVAVAADDRILTLPPSGTGAPACHSSSRHLRGVCVAPDISLVYPSRGRAFHPPRSLRRHSFSQHQTFICLPAHHHDSHPHPTPLPTTPPLLHIYTQHNYGASSTQYIYLGSARPPCRSAQSTRRS